MNKALDLLVMETKTMRPRRLDTAISFALSNHTRAIINRYAEERKLSLGEAARTLLDAGIEARGLA